jgi:hypothetical protein
MTEPTPNPHPDLLEILQARFQANPSRHPGVDWSDVVSRLQEHPEKLRSLGAMEETGGEPDVVGRDPASGELRFVDCSPQSPKGRRSVCYDPAALASRKKNKPRDSALGMAEAIGATLLTEEEYLTLQALGDFDTTTSSWVLTPTDVRDRGGAIFGDRRFGHVFVYHNGAESYYAARGFRCVLRV